MQAKLLKSFGVLLIGMLFWGCSTSVEFSTYEPAKIDLSGYTTLGILPFSSDYSFGSNVEISISPFFRHISFDFSYPYYGGVAEQATQIMYDSLGAERAFIVIPPEQLQHFYSRWTIGSQLSYFADVLQIDALVLGSVIDVDVEDGFEYRYEFSSTAGDRIKTAYYVQDVEVTVEFLVVDTRTHRNIARERRTGRSDFEEYVAPRIEVGTTEASWYTYYKGPSLGGRYKTAVKNALKDVGASMVPQRVKVWRTLMDPDEDPLVELGNELAQDKRYSEALQNYLYAWRVTRAPAAAYNAAIMYEVLGDYPSAITLAEELTTYYYDKKAFTLLTDLRKAQYNKELADAQIQGYVLLQ